MRRLVLLAAALGAVLLARAFATGFGDFNAGINDLDDGNAADAIRHFSAAIASPDTPQHLRDVAYFDRGTAYLSNGDYRAAIADFDKSLTLRPDWIAAHLSRGTAYVGLGQLERARADFSAAIAQQPQIADGYLARAIAYQFERNLDAAIADYSVIVKLEPAAAYTHLWRGAAYRQAGRFREALSDENRAIDIDGQASQGYFERAVTYREQGQYSRAIADFREGLQRAPTNLLGRLNLGLTQWEGGHDNDAIATFNEALKNKSAQGYAAIWLRIVATGPDADAAFARNAAGADTAAWPGPVVNFYRGKATVADVFTAAKEGDPYEAASQRCEANFYVGFYNGAHGQIAEATRLLNDAVLTCPLDTEELGAARTALRRLGGS